jgi:hypothetical protein
MAAAMAMTVGTSVCQRVLVDDALSCIVAGQLHGRVRPHLAREVDRDPELEDVVERLADPLLDRLEVIAQRLAVELRSELAVAERLEPPGEVDGPREGELRVRERPRAGDGEVAERSIVTRQLGEDLGRLIRIGEVLAHLDVGQLVRRLERSDNGPSDGLQVVGTQRLQKTRRTTQRVVVEPHRDRHRPAPVLLDGHPDVRLHTARARTEHDREHDRGEAEAS